MYVACILVCYSILWYSLICVCQVLDKIHFEALKSVILAQCISIIKEVAICCKIHVMYLIHKLNLARNGTLSEINTISYSRDIIGSSCEWWFDGKLTILIWLSLCQLVTSKWYSVNACLLRDMLMSDFNLFANLLSSLQEDREFCQTQNMIQYKPHKLQHN